MGSTARLISLGVLLVLIVVLGVTFFKVLAPFIIPLFLAAMTAIVSQPIYNYFLKRSPQKPSRAAGLTTTLLLSAILIPLITATTLASLQLYSFAADLDWKNFEGWIQNGVDIANKYRPDNEQLTATEVTSQLSQWAQTSLTSMGDKSLGTAGSTIGVVSGILGFVATLLIGLLIYGMGLYYFLVDGRHLLKTSKSLIPVDTQHQQELIEEFAKVVQAVVVATFLAAIGQGLATVIALWFFGFNHLFALGALATLSALIPLLGTWVVWVPCAIWLFSHGRVAESLVLSAYCILFVGFLDNIIRTYVLNSNVKLHPLLAFISVLGGIQAMGLWGVFIGPIVASCLYALIKIFNAELDQFAALRRESETATNDALKVAPNESPEPLGMPPG